MNSKGSIISFVLMCLCVVSYSQTRLENEPMRPSAEAWDQIKYGEIEPSLYTGTVALSIPIFLYRDNDFELPLSISYASNGCVPNVRPGMLGPGWTLNAGGCISREIRGVPDNKDIGGYYGYHSTYDGEFSMDEVFTVWYNTNIPLHPGSLYVTSNSIPYYDAEPDIYHFSLPGCSGSFHLGHGHKVYILNSTVNRNELKIDVDTYKNGIAADYFNAIKITTGDGYVYCFDGKLQGNGNNVEEGQTEPSTKIGKDSTEREILSWNLSRIEAPNGRTVEFKYRRQSEMKSLRPYTYVSSGANAYAGTISSNPSQPTNALEYRRGSLLDRIEVDGVLLASFEYLTGIAEKQYLTGTTGELDANNVRLSAIKIWRGGSLVKECDFGYTETSGSISGVRFLDTVYVKGEGTYSMTYDRVSQYPALGTTSVDHWGYYNGRTGSDYLDVTDFNYTTKDETHKTGNCRIPNSSYASIGMLAKIEYPTGGWTEFDYEPHQYGAAMVRSSINSFEPQLYDQAEIRECGGLRLCAIRHKDKDGSLLTSKSYVYADNVSDGFSSGILVYMPRYKAGYEIRYKLYGVPGTEIGVIKSNNLTFYSGTHIEYDDVIEVNADGSFVKYEYTTSRDYPDIYLSLGGMDYTGNAEIQNPLELTLINKALTHATSRQDVRGKLLSVKMFDSSGDMVSEDATQYLTDSIYNSNSYIKQYEHLIATMNVPAEFVGRIDASGISNTAYFNNGSNSVVSGTAYSYNDYRQIVSETTTDSRGKTLTTAYTYVTDVRKDAVESAMLAANVITAPTAVRIYEDGVLTKETVYVFGQPDVSKPRLFRVMEKREKDVTTSTWHITGYNYDKNGNLLEKTSPDGRKTCWLWGYGGMYPVAVVEGCALESITMLSGFSSVSDGPLPNGLGALEQTLRAGIPSSAQVTVFDYEPLIGLTRASGPDGRDYTYSYNNAGKLLHVLDYAGRKVESHYYSTENR